MNFEELEDLFWDMIAAIMGTEFNTDNIRFSYQQDGQPGFLIDQDVIFIRLFESDDDYAKQLNNIYEGNTTVIKKSARTRVWETQIIAYGPNANQNINKIRDAVFRQDIKRILSVKSVFLVPDMPIAKRIPEYFAGQWWNRWDQYLKWNELYELENEDLGRIDSVSIQSTINRR